METTVAKVIQMRYGQSVEAIKALGGDYYGRAFLANVQGMTAPVVVKLYLFDGLVENEALQLETLARHATLKMPGIYGVYTTEETGCAHDALIMEYLDGVNAGNLDASELSTEAKQVICEGIVNNLIAFHRTVNPAGFGELSAKEFAPTWQEVYRPKAQSIVHKARELRQMSQISDDVLAVFEKSFAHFDDIFCLPITEARLVHGDYNTWNIMLTPDKSRAAYVIDPFGCAFADSEYDLYQLDNANGKEFGLLKRYAEKMSLSENFLQKRLFYELYSEFNHYYDAHVTVNADAVERMAKALAAYLP